MIVESVFHPLSYQIYQIDIQTGHYFDSQEKTFSCPNNCGISTCGAATINGKNITGFIKDFIKNHITRQTSIFETANNLNVFIEQNDSIAEVHFIVAGYEKIGDFEKKQSVYQIVTGKNGSISELSLNGYGVKWDGEISTVTRMIKSCYMCVDPI